MACHCIGNSKMKPIDVDESFDINITIDELESNLNGGTKRE